MENTINKIVEGYIELLTNGNGTKITVSRLCQFCGIHRSSFYRYFESIEDLDGKFLFILYSSRDCDKNSRPQSVPKMIDYLVSIVSIMKRHVSFFSISEERPHLLKYRASWSSIICSEFLSWWPKKRYEHCHPLLDIRLNLSVRLIDSFLNFALTYQDENLRAISFILIEYVTGGRLRVISQSTNINLETDSMIDTLFQEERAILQATDSKKNIK
jgi:hypothetical protein